MDKKINSTQLTSKQHLQLKITLVIGLLLRVLFIVKGGEIYFGKPNFIVQGDTYSWIDSILNLFKHGVYTINLEIPNASFFRPPGYSFLIGCFYLITGGNIEVSIKLLSWTQVLLDVFAIWMVFKIVIRAGSTSTAGLIAAGLYSCYPFIIIWTPVIYAESISVFLMIASLYFLLDPKENSRKYFLSGIIAGLMVLTRLQCIFLVPGLIYLAWKFSRVPIQIRSGAVVFSLSFGLIYGLWPARNLLFQHKLVFAQDLRVGKHWSPDYLSFIDYILALKTDFQPQFQEIIENREVHWPKDSYIIPGDSELLASTVALCRTCGTGFSNKKFYAKLISETVPPDKNCDSIINRNFTLLTEHQKKLNKINYYLITPISNLKKAFFKSNLYGYKGSLVKTVGFALFMYRTLLLFLGLIAIFLNYHYKWFNNYVNKVILVYFIIWYLYLSFFYRNMEIRYLLQCDVLLLFPLSCLIDHFLRKGTTSNV